MAKPWEKPATASGAGAPIVIEGPPREAAPRYPDEAEGSALGVELKRRDLARAPLQDEATRASIASSGHSIESSDLSNAGNIRKQFEAMQPVQDYRVVLPQYISATQAADNQAGDLQLVYAFGKVMDPGSVVREGELDMAQSTGGVGERVKGYISSIQGGARLTPQIRQGLLREIRSRAHNIAEQYNQIRGQYKGIAERSGFAAEDIVGPHPGGPFQQAEADFVHRPIINLDGSQGASPQKPYIKPLTEGLPSGPLEVEITDERLPGESEEQYRHRIDAGLTDKPPDISQARPESGSLIQSVDAGVRGIADTATFGLADEFAASMDSIFGAGTQHDNLRRQRAIDQFDTQHNFGGRLTGQLGGGLLLGRYPVVGVASTPGRLARSGAIAGTAYGFGSGQGDFGDRALSAFEGGVAGGATGAAFGYGGRALAPAFGAVGRRIVGPSTPRQSALLAAGEAEGVPLNMSDVFPGTRNTVATLETIPGAAGPVQRGIGAGRDALEARVQNLGRGGTSREDMGQVVLEAGERFVGKANQQASRLYNHARRVAADTPIQPQSVTQVLSTLVREEAQTPGGTKAGEVIARYAKAFEEGGQVTIDGARRMRSELLSRLRDDGGLSKAQATRITGQIMGGINEDIERSLAAAGRQEAVEAYRLADRFYAQSREEIEQITERFIGTDARPKPPEQILSALQNAMGPKGNSPGLAGMLRRLSPDERRDFAATLVEPLGRRSAEEPFSPATFIGNVRKISPAARRLVFGDDGERSIQNLIRLSVAKRETVQSLNNSRSGQTNNYRSMLSNLLVGLPAGGAVAAMGASLNGPTGAVGGVAIGASAIAFSRQLSKALMNERFTRLLTNAPATRSSAAIDAHLGKMRRLAATNPEIRSVVENLEQRLLAAVNDNVGTPFRAAASDSAGRDSRNDQNQR